MGIPGTKAILGPWRVGFSTPFTHRWKLLVRIHTQNSVLCVEMSTSDNTDAGITSWNHKVCMLSVFQTAATSAYARSSVGVAISHVPSLRSMKSTT